MALTAAPQHPLSIARLEALTTKMAFLKLALLVTLLVRMVTLVNDQLTLRKATVAQVKFSASFLRLKT